MCACLICEKCVVRISTQHMIASRIFPWFAHMMQPADVIMYAALGDISGQARQRERIVLSLRTSLYAENNCNRVCGDENRGRPFWGPVYWFTLYGMMWTTSESIVCMKIPCSTIAMLPSSLGVSLLLQFVWFQPFLDLFCTSTVHPGTLTHTHTYICVNTQYMYIYTVIFMMRTLRCMLLVIFMMRTHRYMLLVILMMRTHRCMLLVILMMRTHRCML